MSKIFHLIRAISVMAVLGVAGCTSPQPSDITRLQGTWEGQEVGSTTPGTCRLLVAGRSFEFHAADPNEWYKGTFTLREETMPKQMVATITDCPAADYVGKVDRAIYRLEGGTLTLSAFEPGTPNAPTTFDAPNARQFVLKAK